MNQVKVERLQFYAPLDHEGLIMDCMQEPVVWSPDG